MCSQDETNSVPCMILTWTINNLLSYVGVERMPITRAGVERIPISHKESARQKADPGGEEDSPAALVTRTACRDLLPGSRLTRIRFSGQPSYLSPLPTPLWTSFRPKPRVDMWAALISQIALHNRTRKCSWLAADHTTACTLRYSCTMSTALATTWRGFKHAVKTCVAAAQPQIRTTLRALLSGGTFLQTARTGYATDWKGTLYLRAAQFLPTRSAPSEKLYY